MSHDTSSDHRPAGLFARVKRALSGQSGGLRESLEDVIETHDAAPGGDRLSVEQRSMLRNLIAFDDLRVDDAMVPRADIVAIEDVASMRNLLEAFTQANHSRMPVYHETLDNITGMVHVKDFLRWLEVKGSKRRGKAATGLALPVAELSSAIKSHGSLIRDVLFVPPSMPAADLLLKMKSSHVHLAIVIDEYGGTDGLLSIEDLVELIVGDISDEHDTDEDPHITRVDDLTHVADARVAIAKLDEMFGVDLLPDEEEDEADTLAGLIYEMVGHVPARGEIIRHDSGIEFEILETDRRRVKRVRVHLPPPRPETEGGDA